MSTKVPLEFGCNACDYNTSSRRDFKKHLATRKHAISKEYVQIQPKSPLRYRCECGRAYRHRGSLFNHRRKCDGGAEREVVEASPLPAADPQAVDADEEKAWLREQIKEMRELMKMMIPNIGDHVVKDNQIAVNVFLNDKCKDAVNFQDFVDQISVSIEDLLLTKRIGYSQGVSNILIRHLNDMHATDRPIHCSDRSKMRFYVKEVRGWNEDDGVSVGNAIASITQKQIATIKTWEAQYPNWHQHAGQTEEYATMVRRVMGGSTDEEVEKNRKEILRSVGGAVNLNSVLSLQNTVVSGGAASSNTTNGGI